MTHAEYNGPGDAWTPEHLLLAAVQSCFLFTLRAVARASRLEFVSLVVEAAGTVDRRNGVTSFTEIVLHIRLTVPASADSERAVRVLDQTKHACLVSNSLSTPIWVEAEIVAEAPEPASVAQ